MHDTRRLYLALAGLLVTSMAEGMASGQATASVKGVVFDPTSRLMPGATLVLTSATQPAVRRNHTTDRTGVYEFRDLAPGAYEFEVTAAGFRIIRAKVDLTGPVEQNFRLTIGALHETITIVGGFDDAALSIPRQATASSQAADAGTRRNAQIEAMCGKGKPGRVGGLIVPPQKVRHVNPSYPVDLARARLGGIVALVGSITAEGGVANLRHDGAGHDTLVQAMTAAVSQWQFLPVMLNCEPIAVEFNVIGRFVPNP
jgi:Carboxypeptidase regulatory-like domain/Gram-negative bacterial TonB protein C-terminal